MGRDYNRINELIGKIFDGDTCIFTYDHVAPKTFPADIARLFKVDVEKDVLRNVLVGDEEGLVDSTFILLTEPIDKKDLFIKLANYVNAIGVDFVLCCCKDSEGVYRCYEIDLNDEYIEGGNPPFIDVENGVNAGEQNILLLSERLENGSDKSVLPSPVIKSIEEGNHYIKHLIGPNDEDWTIS